MDDLSLALFAQTLCVDKCNKGSRFSPSKPHWSCWYYDFFFFLKKEGKNKINQFYLRSFTIWWKRREKWNPDPQSAFLCSVRQSCHLSPPASTRKYYDCITQTIFTCKNVPRPHKTLRTDGHITSDGVLAHLNGTFAWFFYLKKARENVYILLYKHPAHVPVYVLQKNGRVVLNMRGMLSAKCFSCSKMF